MAINGTIEHDKLLSMKEIILPLVFNSGRFDHGRDFEACLGGSLRGCFVTVFHNFRTTE